MQNFMKKKEKDRCDKPKPKNCLLWPLGWPSTDHSLTELGCLRVLYVSYYIFGGELI